MKGFVAIAAALIAAASAASVGRKAFLDPEEQGGFYQGDIMNRPGSSSKNGLIDESYRWPNGVVPYTIVGSFSVTEMDTIQAALDEYSVLTDGCVQFKERDGEDDFVFFTSFDTGCHSYVGRMGGPQEINYASPGCLTRYGTVQHEMLHALGFYHEQSEYDRDDYVTIKYDRDDYVAINWDNIQSGYEHNFDKYDENTITRFGEDYDYGSAMHYSSTAFSVNGEETITPKDPNADIGQRIHLSDIDIAKLKKMYNCP